MFDSGAWLFGGRAGSTLEVSGTTESERADAREEGKAVEDQGKSHGARGNGVNKRC